MPFILDNENILALASPLGIRWDTVAITIRAPLDIAVGAYGHFADN